MIDIINKHLAIDHTVCKVAQWIDTLEDKEKQAFQSIREQQMKINAATLYKELNAEVELPFGMTAFRSHLRGYCACPKK
jgi:phage-related tail protein